MATLAGAAIFDLLGAKVPALHDRKAARQMSVADGTSPPASVLGEPAGGSGSGGADTATAGIQSLPHLTRDWMRLSQEIDALSAEVKAKRRRMKETRAMILQVMRGNALGVLNVSAGQVVREEKETKAAISKKYLNSTLVAFFEGDVAKARACAAWIEEHRPIKAAENLTIRPRPPTVGGSTAGSTM